MMVVMMGGGHHLMGLLVILMVHAGVAGVVDRALLHVFSSGLKLKIRIIKFENIEEYDIEVRVYLYRS